MPTETSSRAEWRVCASEGAMNTSNPIREIIETMNLAENPAKKVIPLSIGDPTIFGNLKPCHAILDAIQRANASGKFYGYQTAAGMESARKAVAKYHNTCTGNQVREQDVILASGCSHAIDLCICVLARHGQNILIPRPGFPLYKTLTSVYGVKFKQYDLLAEQNWSVDLKHLESLIDSQTAAIVINNPSNPCGSVFSKRHLREILALAERHRLPIISDEIYDKFVFSPELYDEGEGEACGDGERARQPTESPTASNSADSGNYAAEDEEEEDEQENLVSCGDADNAENRRPEVANDHTQDQNEEDADSALEDDKQQEPQRENNARQQQKQQQQQQQQFRYVRFRSLASLSDTVPILTCGGISKTCLIPGLRLGWIIINDKRAIFDASIRHGLSRLTQRLMGPNSLVQGALHDILTNVPEDFYKQTMDFIFKNAKLCYERLLGVRGLHPYMPQGSMYLMVGFDAQLFPNIEGDLDFTSKLMNEQSVLVLPGKCFDFPNFFRICLTVPTIVMEDALNRIEEFCRDHATPVADIATSDEQAEPARIQSRPAETNTQRVALKQQQQQRVALASSPRSNTKQQNVKQQQTTTTITKAPILNKKLFDSSLANTIQQPSGQQLARSKCK